MFGTCPTLCPLQFLLLDFSWLYRLAPVNVPNYVDATKEFSLCNVIFMRMISLCVKHAYLRLERFYLPFPFCQRVAFRSMLGGGSFTTDF